MTPRKQTGGPVVGCAQPLGLAEPDWMEAPESGRRATLVAALRRLWEVHPGPARIVETGTLRDEAPRARESDGWSTLAFGWYAARTGGRLTTIDVSEAAMETCRRVTAEYAPAIDYVVGDSVALLDAHSAEGKRQKEKGKDGSDGLSPPVRQSKPENRKSKTDFLYLDSLDYEDREASEAQHQAEAEAALPALAERCLVLIDDTSFHHGDTESRSGEREWEGKGARAVPFLLERGFKVEWARGGQVLLSRGVPLPGLAPVPEPPYRRAVAESQQLARLPALRQARAAFERWSGPVGAWRLSELVRTLAGRGGSTCEVDDGPAFGAIWLSQVGAAAQARLPGPRLVEWAQVAQSWLGGGAAFSTGGLFDFGPSPDEGGTGGNERSEGWEQGSKGAAEPNRWRVIHHRGMLHRYPLPWIRAALARQAACADWVVFEVPSVYAPTEVAGEDGRLLPLEEWRRILEPFDVAELRYERDGRESVLAVLRGCGAPAAAREQGRRGAGAQGGSDWYQMRGLMEVTEEAFPPGVSAIVHARNEAGQIAACLETLRWADEIIVCDMESTDDTAAIARRTTPHVLTHPLIPDFDRARNVSAMRARFRWVLFLDADERFPAALVPWLLAYLRQSGDQVAAVQLPFEHHFLGRPMRCLSPGYKAPPVFKNGCFFYNARPHAGAQLAGPVGRFPASEPTHWLAHHSNPTLFDLREKQNRYTESEADHMERGGESFHWQSAVRAMVEGWKGYYDGQSAVGGTDRRGVRQTAGELDGVRGLLWSIYGGFYEFEKAAKLWERRARAGALHPSEEVTPPSVEALLEHALAVAREDSPLRTLRTLRVVDRAKDEAGPASRQGGAAVDSPPLTPDPPPHPSGPAEVVVTGPVLDPSGYGEESREFAFALEDAGVPVAAEPVRWSDGDAGLSPATADRLAALIERPAAAGFTQLIQEFPTRLRRHPAAGRVVVRTMFETDRLPPEWARILSRPEIDAVLVPSEFNRQTFAASGVPEEKLVGVPGCIGGEEYGRVGVWTCGSGGERTTGSTSRAPTQWAGAVKGSGVGDQGSDRTTASDRSGSSSTTSSRSSSMEGGEAGPYTFLSVFDWSLHKGWDVLLRGFLRAFREREEARLLLKVWSTLGVSTAEMRGQAAELARREFGHDLESDPRVVWLTEPRTRAEMLELYRSADAFVLPSRGEGWGRPYMEAMACGVPTVGTGWSGNTAFMTSVNSHLLGCRLVPVPEAGWREIAAYRGHRWAEPDAEQLAIVLQRMMEHPRAERALGERGRQHVLTEFSRAVVGRRLAEVLGVR